MPTTTAAAGDDAHLVARSLGGDREAFRTIVARYQALVCSIAYSATGSLALSEDLAQETFLAAWRQLGDLRDPSLLRAWVSGIARNVAHDSVRRRKRDAVFGAQPLDAAAGAHAADPIPVDRAISREEENILWRSLEAVPETYREPLVLYYREHQAIDRVAGALGVSHDVVKQRLSRGRKLLAAEVLAFVEGTLERSAPGPGFALGVIAALPSATTAMTVGAVGAAAAKGGAIAKSVAFGAALSALFGAGTGALGLWYGLRTGLDVARTPRERALAIRTWKLACAAGIGFTAGAILLAAPYRFWSRHVEAFVAAAVAIPALFTGWIVVVVVRSVNEQRRVREEERRAHPEAFDGAAARKPIELRSATTLLGLPLWHVRLDTAGGDDGPVVAWIAVGDTAYGVLFAMGQLAVGTISLGAVNAGVVAVGGVAAGVLPIGGVSVGVFAVGTIGAGLYAMGAVAFGWRAAAGAIAFGRAFALGRFALGDHADDDAAVAFFRSIGGDALFPAVIVITLVVLIVPLAWTRLLVQRSKSPTSTE